MWFIWSSAEEQRIQQDRAYAYLQTPEYLIQEALILLFVSPSIKIPLAGLIVQRYCSMGSDPVTNETVKLLRLKYAPSFVLRYTTPMFLGQYEYLKLVDANIDAALSAVIRHKEAEQHAAAHAEASLPTQTMLNVKEFLSNRQQRWNVIIKVETPRERQERLMRELRLGVRPAALIYNSFDHGWDLCREFGLDLGAEYDDAASEDLDAFDSESEHELDDKYTISLLEPLTPLPPSLSYYRSPSPPAFFEQQTLTPGPVSVLFSIPSQPEPGYMDVEDDEDNETPAFAHYSGDIIQTLSFGYGYVPSMPGDIAPVKLPDAEWKIILKY
ncbi:hypothetical protein BDN70DRAFT_896699 [Pholiota conissans]|uniref:Uncharacterized protein n=1 Tax=Pholiota conissans TaxID=109636 RepID=A0A9P5YWX8_9AGAR|nr:hypothetical protein BDN70DRAFT_896699 [Pholiota conissans]